MLAVGEGFLQVAPLPQADEARRGRDRVLVLVDQARDAPRTSIAPAPRRSWPPPSAELAAWKGELDGAYQALVERRGWAQARLDAAARVSAH